jgi:A/G-specific adenine glycosylase
MLALDIPALRAALLAWYDAQARDLPWRTGPAAGKAGQRSDPYRVWLSEVMLQQTTVPHATPYFLSFTQRWPTVSDLAAVEDGDLMAAWAGLGYYARARNLLACARAVAADHGGVFPDTEEGLARPAGRGRLHRRRRGRHRLRPRGQRGRRQCRARDGPAVRGGRARPDAKPELKRLAGELVTAERPGDWAQALMDLGATICRPKGPLCDRCPIQAWCEGFKTGAPETYPRKTKKADRPRRFGVAYVLTRGDATALVRRPPKGLLGGMLGLPTSDWRATPWTDEEARGRRARPAPGATSASWSTSSPTSP